MGDTPCSLGKGILRGLVRISLQVAEQESKQHSLSTTQGAFVQTLGHALTWILDQCLSAGTLATSHQSVPDQSHHEGKQTFEGASQTWRTNGQLRHPNTNVRVPTQAPEAGHQRHPEPQRG